MSFYIDSEYHCHATNPNGDFREVKHPYFDGKCNTFIEGYCYDDSKGYVAIYPWKPLSELDSAQREYERQSLAAYESELRELRENSIPTSDLEAAYKRGVDSV